LPGTTPCPFEQFPDEHELALSAATELESAPHVGHDESASDVGHVGGSLGVVGEFVAPTGSTPPGRTVREARNQQAILFLREDLIFFSVLSLDGWYME
jgi:hypothetical protein